MISLMYKNYGENLEEAYNNKQVYIHNTKNAYVVEYVKKCSYNGSYYISLAGVNAYNVPMHGTNVTYKGVEHLFFQCAGGGEYAQKAFAVNGKNETDAAAILYA